MSNGKPRNGWRKVKTTDILSGIITGKKDVNQAEQSGEYPFFSCARETTLFSNEFLLDTDAILVSGNGSYTGFVKAYSGKFDLYQRTYALFDFKEGVNWRFIYYLFKYYFEQRYMGGTSGAAIPYITKPVLTDFEFFVPQDNSIQNEIASTLTAYDDLIENNRRRIQLLEESARLLYNEWFVQLRFPGHEHVRIIDGVPEGWDKKILDELCYQVKVSVDPSEVDGVTPYIGLEHIPRRSITLSEWETAEKVTSGKYSYQEGDIIFGKIRPYFHKIGFALTSGITSSDAIVIRPHGAEHYAYLLMLISSDQFVALASKTVKEGSKMPRADWTFLSQQYFLVPSSSLLEVFQEQIATIVKQLKVLAFQNKQLAQARDILIPRLMNGELAV